MRPFKIVQQHLPKQAGKAILRWTTSKSRPEREGEVIWLPVEEAAEFVPLLGGEQFLYLICGGGPSSDQLYFGGTDENPFLAELSPNAKAIIYAIRERGEQAFYDYLKPEGVKRLEEALGVTTKRQGDIFAVPMGMDWKTFRAYVSHIRLATNGDETKAAQHRVFGTRHALDGHAVTVITFGEGVGIREKPTEYYALFGSGVLVAPDHSPVKLEGVHAIDQVRVLRRPHDAD